MEVLHAYVTRANVGVKGDLWQAEPDTGSPLERVVRYLLSQFRALFLVTSCPRFYLLCDVGIYSARDIVNC